MTDYTKLVRALRCELHYTSCPVSDCKYICHDTFCDTYRLMVDAAAAIEELQAEVNRLELDNEDYEYTLRERYDEPKRGEIVRCGECIHFTQGGWCDREFDWFPVDENDFCSMAEKMEVQE